MDQSALEAVWAKILRTLREEKNFALFGLLANMDDIEFVDGKICLHLHNDAEKSIIKEHFSALKTMAGVDVEWNLQDDTQIIYDENRDYVARLKDLFGDKVEIV